MRDDGEGIYHTTDVVHFLFCLHYFTIPAFRVLLALKVHFRFYNETCTRTPFIDSLDMCSSEINTIIGQFEAILLNFRLLFVFYHKRCEAGEHTHSNITALPGIDMCQL